MLKISCLVTSLALWPISALMAEPNSDLTPRRTAMKVDQSQFGTLPIGEDESQADRPHQIVHRYQLTNASGANVTVCDFGATLMDVNVPDRDGKLANVNIAFDQLQRYVDGHPYFGATVGRYANRIGGASFEIDGTTFELTKNHGDHILHGGKDNFAYQLWDATTFCDDDTAGVTFRLQSPAGDNGFPGNVDVKCTYIWNNDSELTVKFEGTTDAATHLSLTNHSYFNLGGVGSGLVYDYQVQIEAEQTLAVDEDLIPHGDFADVGGTPFDFRRPHRLGERIDQLPATKGYDHCFVIRGPVGQMRDAALIVDPASGRTLAIETTFPGMQLYTANHLGGGVQNAGQSQHQAFCVETQMFPNSPNVPTFPTTLVRPGETMTASTIHRFGVAK